MQEFLGTCLVAGRQSVDETRDTRQYQHDQTCKQNATVFPSSARVKEKQIN